MATDERKPDYLFRLEDDGYVRCQNTKDAYGQTIGEFIDSLCGEFEWDKETGWRDMINIAEGVFKRGETVPMYIGEK